MTVCNGAGLATAETVNEARSVTFLAFKARVIKELCKKTREDIVAIGRHLTDCQNHLGHGAWLPWLKREFGWTDRTALSTSCASTR